jgi:hypothetical protein
MTFGDVGLTAPQNMKRQGHAQKLPPQPPLLFLNSASNDVSIAATPNSWAAIGEILMRKPVAMLVAFAGIVGVATPSLTAQKKEDTPKKTTAKPTTATTQSQIKLTKSQSETAGKASQSQFKITKATQESAGSSSQSNQKQQKSNRNSQGSTTPQNSTTYDVKSNKLE